MDAFGKVMVNYTKDNVRNIPPDQIEREVNEIRNKATSFGIPAERQESAYATLALLEGELTRRHEELLDLEAATPPASPTESLPRPPMGASQEEVDRWELHERLIKDLEEPLEDPYSMAKMRLEQQEADEKANQVEYDEMQKLAENRMNHRVIG